MRTPTEPIVMRDEVTKFIDAYRDALSRGPRAIAELYSEPCLIATSGVVRVNATRRETELLCAELDSEHRTRGFTHAEILTIDVQPLGSTSALATVQWAYMGACEELLWRTTFSYNVCRCDGAWKIAVQIVHAS